MPETDTCSAARRRDHSFSDGAAACQPTSEQIAAKSEAARQEAERAAAEKRDAYFASGEDMGGRCKSASSDARVVPTYSKDDPALKDSLRTKAIDLPLRDDPLGNALVAAIAGGIVGGVRAAASEAAAGVAGPSVVAHVASETAKEIVKDGATEAVKETLRRTVDDASVPRAAAPPPKPANTAVVRSATESPLAPAGRSSSRATSEPVPEASQSQAPRPVPLVLVIRG